MSISVHSAAQNNQLSLLRSLVSENPLSVNAVDAVGVRISPPDAPHCNVVIHRTVVHHYNGLQQGAI